MDGFAYGLRPFPDDKTMLYEEESDVSRLVYVIHADFTSMQVRERR